MYIEEILKIPDCTMKLSCYDPEKKSLLDFDANLFSKEPLKSKIDMLLAKKNLDHYILVENISYDKKKIDFSSKTVDCTLYLNLKNGKTYRWQKVAVSFIRIGGENIATCIIAKQNAFPYNRRDTFRIPVDCEGKVFWDEDEKPEPCIVKDVSHGGLGIFLDKSSRKLFKGLPAKVTWEETANFDNNGNRTTRKFNVAGRIVRRQVTLDNDIIVGIQMNEEPDAIRDYIQWAQVHRGFQKENEKPSVPKGVSKQENWQLQKQLEQMAGQDN